jgi:hypothetical protein
MEASDHTRARTRWVTERIASLEVSEILRTKTQDRIGFAEWVLSRSQNTGEESGMDNAFSVGQVP